MREADPARMQPQQLLCCLLADDGDSDGYDRASKAAESIYIWGHRRNVTFMNSS